jgi:hypothetical protein
MPDARIVGEPEGLNRVASQDDDEQQSR